MKITEVNIKNFGKFHNVGIRFRPGINVIYGENEAGKSTIHTFIKSMLFGLERGRGRAALKDTFRIYEPWENPNYYAGELQFECAGKSFRLSRNFDRYNKSVRLYCEDDGEELSVDDGDLEVLLEGLNTGVYENTISIGQMNAKPGQTLAVELENYATNYYASGDDDLDVDAAMNLLKNQKKDLDRKLSERVQNKQKELEQLEHEASYIWRDVHKLMERQEKLEEEYDNRYEETAEPEPEEGVFSQVADELRHGKWRIHPLEIIGFLIVIASAFWFVKRPWNSFVTVILISVFLLYIWNRLKVGKRQEKTESEKLLESITNREESMPLERLKWEIIHNKEELHEKQILYNNLREQLEEAERKDSVDLALQKQSEEVQLAILRIEEMSKSMQKQMGIRLNQKLSSIISFLTDGKYTRLFADDNLKLWISCEGKQIPLEQVSRGTAEQIYFALRMASAEVLCEDDYPVILDDAFAYYDDRRLERTLNFLAQKKEQVLIFTCQDREQRLLDAEGIPYNLYKIKSGEQI